jgi:NADH-quinone oxidoreductase subunit F
MLQVLRRIEQGQGRPEDLDLLASLTPRIGLRTLCALGDAAIGPVESSLQKFRHEYEHHIVHKTCYAKGHRLHAAVAAH